MRGIKQLHFSTAAAVGDLANPHQCVCAISMTIQIRRGQTHPFVKQLFFYTRVLWVAF